MADNTSNPYTQDRSGETSGLYDGRDVDAGLRRLAWVPSVDLIPKCPFDGSVMLPTDNGEWFCLKEAEADGRR